MHISIRSQIARMITQSLPNHVPTLRGWKDGAAAPGKNEADSEDRMPDLQLPEGHPEMLSPEEIIEYLARTRHDLLGELNIASGFLSLLAPAIAEKLPPAEQDYHRRALASLQRAVETVDKLLAPLPARMKRSGFES
jgi:hypothetical protein